MTRSDPSGRADRPPSHNGDEPEHPPGVAPCDEDRILALARTAYGMRRKRDAVVGAKLFRDPAWEHREMSVMALSKAGAAPTTTALRHISVLESAGLLRRRRPSREDRRFRIEVTPRCFEQMKMLFSSPPERDASAAPI
jgi:hypothetical protein